MAKETFNEEDGVWRTVGGRRIFIRNGQSLADAMVKSGKFKSLRSTYRKEKAKQEQEEKERLEDEELKKYDQEKWEKTVKEVEKANKPEMEKLEKEGKENYAKKQDNRENYIQQFNEKYKNKSFYDERTGDTITAETIADDYIKYGVNQSFEDFARKHVRDLQPIKEEKPSKNISANDATNELMNADVGDWNNMNQAQRDKQCEKILNDFEDKYGNKLEDKKFRNEVLEQLEDQNFHTMGKVIEQKYEYSDNKELKDLDKRIEKAEKEESEYELYKRAKEHPETIDPMTENSTDWEALEEKYGGKEETYPRASGSPSFEDMGLQVSDKKAFSDYLRDKYGSDDFRIINFENKEGAKKIYDEYASQREKDRIAKYFSDQEESALKNNDLTYGYSTKGLESMSNQQLDDYIKRQEELVKEYTDSYNKSSQYDQRYTRNRQDTLFDRASKTKYEQNLKNAQEEKAKREEETNKYFKKEEKQEKQVSKDSGFIQQTDMHGGTYEYTKDRLDKMNEAGVHPMEHSYTGGGWEGNKYDSKLSTKEIAKNINDYSKKEFPDVKISRKTDYNGIDVHVMSSGKDLYTNDSDIDKMSDKQVSDTIRDSVGGYTRMDDWLNDNNRKGANGTFTSKDERDYLKEQLKTYKSRKDTTVNGNEWYLSDYGKKVISGLNKEMNSYNFDDSDGMVDYFNTNFYGYVHIGKWDKPYEVSNSSSSSDDWVRDAFNKYKEEHPGTKKTFAAFKKENKE